MQRQEPLATFVKRLGIKGARATAEDDLSLDAEAFARIASELFATRPLRAVRLWKATGPELVAALETPELSRVRELHLTRNRLSAEDVEALVHASPLTELVRLELGFCGLSGRTGALLAAADPRRMPALRALSLFANKLGATGVRALAESLFVRQLTELDLEANHGGDEAIAALLASPAVENLERLVVGRNEADVGARKALVESAHVRRLTKLEGLAGTDVDAVLARNARANMSWTAPPAPEKPLAKSPAPAVSASRPRAEDLSRGLSLVARLAATPRDAELRAVYADWLQEQGDPRGELLALEAKRAAGGDEAPQLKARIDRLRSKVAKDFQQRFRNKSALLRFDAGLIVEVGGQLRWFLEHGREIFAREPVRCVHVYSPSAAGLAKLADVPGFDRVRRIDIATVTPKLVQAVPWSSLPNLSLRLHVWTRELEPFLALPELRCVRALAPYAGFTLGHLETLARHPALVHLEELRLQDPLGDAAADVILKSSWKLARLDVTGCGIGAPWIKELQKRFGDGAVRWSDEQDDALDTVR